MLVDEQRQVGQIDYYDMSWFVRRILAHHTRHANTTTTHDSLNWSPPIRITTPESTPHRHVGLGLFRHLSRALLQEPIGKARHGLHVDVRTVHIEILIIEELDAVRLRSRVHQSRERLETCLTENGSLSCQWSAEYTTDNRTVPGNQSVCLRCEPSRADSSTNIRQGHAVRSLALTESFKVGCLGPCHPTNRVRLHDSLELL